MSAAKDMLTALYARGVGEYIEVRRIDPLSGRVAQEFIPPAAMEHLLDLVEAFARRMDVYVGVAMRTEKSGGKDAIAGVQALWADIDTPEALVEMTAFEMPPSIVVASGTPGAHHAYWLLEEAVSVPEAEALLRLLAKRLGSDRAVTDASRILRVPGTLNHKTDPPRSVKLVEVSNRAYRAADLRDVLAADEQPRSADAEPAEVAAPSPPVANVLGKLEGVRPSGTSWKALCPAHDDTTPSLSIAQAEDGRCLVHCFAGCEVETVLGALGLTLRDLFAAGATGRTSSEQQLVALVEEAGVKLFHDPRGRAFAAFDAGGHRECWQVEAGGFSRWLRLRSYKQYGRTPSPEKLRSAIDLFSAQAEFEGDEIAVRRRVGGDLERLVIDLGDARWRAVEISAKGWKVVDRPDVMFQRDPGTLPLALPVTGGSLNALRDLFNVSEAADWTRLTGGLIGAFHPTGPYLVTFVMGPAGSGKSFAVRQLASMIDPYDPQAIVGKPNPHDLLVAASRSWLTVMDNVPALNRELSDMLAVISTGAGDRRRALYTNDDLFAIVAKGPIVTSSLTQIARVPDLISRGNFVWLDEISDAERRRESDLQADFSAARPQAFGSLLDILSGALAHVDDVHLTHLPRMADVATLVTAAEHVMDVPIGSFCAAVEAAQEDARGRSAESSPFVEAVIKLVETLRNVEASMSELLARAAKVPGVDSKSPAWPRNANAASHQLDEHSATLGDHGITFKRARRAGGTRERYVHLTVSRDAGHPGTTGEGGDGAP